MTEIILSENEFYKQYNLIKNHIDDNAPFDGRMFETYGKELDYIHEMVKNPETQHKVWTIIEGDGDALFYSSGYHIVNRIGYLITEESVDVNTFITVEIETN